MDTSSYEDIFAEISITKIDEENARRIREKIIKINHLDPNRPITLTINTYGGSVYAMATIIESMESVSNPFITVALGACMSAGAIILSAGDFRFAGRYSRIMIHEVSAGAVGHINDIEASVEDIRSLNDQWLNFLALRCKKKNAQEIKDFIRKAGVRDLNMTPDQAKEFGVVDFVGIPDIRPVYFTQVATLPEKKYRDLKERSEEGIPQMLRDSVPEQLGLAPKKNKKSKGKANKKFIAKKACQNV